MYRHYCTFFCMILYMFMCLGSTITGHTHTHTEIYRLIDRERERERARMFERPSQTGHGSMEIKLIAGSLR